MTYLRLRFFDHILTTTTVDRIRYIRNRIFPRLDGHRGAHHCAAEEPDGLQTVRDYCPRTRPRALQNLALTTSSTESMVQTLIVYTINSGELPAPFVLCPVSKTALPGLVTRSPLVPRERSARKADLFVVPSIGGTLTFIFVSLLNQPGPCAVESLIGHSSGHAGASPFRRQYGIHRHGRRGHEACVPPSFGMGAVHLTHIPSQQCTPTRSSQCEYFPFLSSVTTTGRALFADHASRQAEHPTLPI